MQRVYNFSAGPSMLPLEVLEQAQKELVVYKDSGMSVMEMSHRSKVFEEIIQTAEKDLRILMNIPDNYNSIISPRRRQHPVCHGAAEFIS